MSDVNLAFAVSLIAFGSWTIFCLLVPRHRPWWAVFVWLISLGMLGVAWLAVYGQVNLLGVGVDAILIATVNRAVVAAFGIVLTIRVVVHRMEARHRRRAGHGP